MSPKPTGRLILTPEGRDLVIIRTFNAPIEDVWASITEPERTARWFGHWSGQPGPGRTIHYTMLFEEDAPASTMLIKACEAPRHLAVQAINEYGNWNLEAHLSEQGGVTELRFTQHLDSTTNVGDVGPGWEYYLDMLVESREGGTVLDFNDYYPSQKQHYLDQLPA